MRRRDCDVLADSLTAVREGRGAVVAVIGEAGAGKSYLVSDAISTAPGDIAAVLDAYGEAIDRDVPFAFLASVTDLSTGERPFADIVAGVNPSTSASPRIGVAEAIITALDERLSSTPIALVADDTQWADAASVALLHRLARRTRLVPLLLVVVARPHPTSAELDRLLSFIEVAGVVVRLGPLTPAETSQLAEEVLGEVPTGRVLERLHAAGGNPFYVTELLRELVRDSTATSISSASPSLRLTILRRLSHLSPDAISVLRSAAVLGPILAAEDLAAVMQSSLRSLAPALRELIAQSLLVERGGLLRFQHDLVQEAVYLDSPEAVRRAEHVDAARRLAAEGRALQRVAAQFQRGAQPGDGEAISWLLRAADAAGTTSARDDAELSSRDAVSAIDLYACVLSLMEDDDPRQASTLIALGQQHLWIGKHAAAAESFAVAATKARDLMTRWHARMLQSRVLVMLGDAQTALEVLDGLDTPELGEAEVAFLHATRANALATAFRTHEAVAAAETAVAMGTAAGVTEAVAFAEYTLAWIDFVAGRAHVALEHSLRSTAPIAGRPSLLFLPPGAFAPGGQHALIQIDNDEFDAARRTMQERVARVEVTNERYSAPIAHAVAGVERYLVGAWDEAAAEAQTAVDIAAETGDTPAGQSLAASLLAVIAARSEDHELASRSLAIIEEDTATGRLRGYEHHLTRWARGLVARCRGDQEKATALLTEAWNIATAIQAITHYRLIAPDYIDCMLTAGDTSRSDAAADLVQVVAERNANLGSARAFALRCRGLAGRDVSVLAQAADLYAGSVRLLETAETKADFGRLCAVQGRAEHAKAHLLEALSAFASFGAHRDVRLVQAELRRLGVPRGARGPRGRALFGPNSLTRTEREVAQLVAAGHTNREIAERLYVSPRTIDTHVAHIFQKLGINSRAHLATAFDVA